MKIYDSGAAEINATDGSVEDPTPLVVTASPGSASKFTVAAATTTLTAGVPDDQTVTAVDTYGNAAETYKGTKSRTGAAISTTAFGYTAPNATSCSNTITASTSGLTSGTVGTSR